MNFFAMENYSLKLKLIIISSSSVNIELHCTSFYDIGTLRMMMTIQKKLTYKILKFIVRENEIGVR
jgi:hypothetical protein